MTIDPEQYDTNAAPFDWDLSAELELDGGEIVSHYIGLYNREETNTNKR